MLLMHFYIKKEKRSRQYLKRTSSSTTICIQILCSGNYCKDATISYTTLLFFFFSLFHLQISIHLLNALLWAMSYIKYCNSLPCVQYCSKREETEIPNTVSFYTCSERQWLFQNVNKITISNGRTQILNSIHLSHGLMHMCFKSCPI